MIILLKNLKNVYIIQLIPYDTIYQFLFHIISMHVIYRVWLISFTF